MRRVRQATTDGRTKRVPKAACEEQQPWLHETAQLGAGAQRALHSEARVYDNATGGAYVPAGEGCQGDLSYMDKGQKMKRTGLRAETMVAQAQALVCPIGLLLRDVSVAVHTAGMEPVLAALRLSGEDGSSYVYPPELKPNESLGQTQYGMRLKGYPEDGWDWQLDDAVRSISALHCDKDDTHHECALLGSYSFKFTGCIVYVGISRLTRADRVPREAPKTLFGTSRGSRQLEVDNRTPTAPASPESDSVAAESYVHTRTGRFSDTLPRP